MPRKKGEYLTMIMINIYVHGCFDNLLSIHCSIQNIFNIKHPVTGSVSQRISSDTYGCNFNNFTICLLVMMIKFNRIK